MIKGSIVDLVTPQLADGAPDLEAIEALMDWHVSERSAAVLIGGAAGQVATPDFEDRRELLQRAIWQADGRLPVIAAVRLDEASEALVMARAAEEAGAHALLLELPGAIASSSEELLAQIRTLAQATKLPLIVRPATARSAPLPAAVVAELTKIKGVAGFVEGSADSNRVRELLALGLPKDFALYSGHDGSARVSILQGFHGCISITANVAPSLVRDVHAAALAGDRNGSEELEARLHPLYEALMTEAHSAPVKWALVEMGKINEGPQPPKLPQSSDYSHLRRALRSAKVLG
ncbi:4-hydroxy-tetrahydrodipicolinate synthase [Panacagrimonas perspica]|uniref:4-hydroxy-tetrahydrodipicolinate synthase n=1 Tax=Panacagrimonas perspica TaxID=381431 RepID=A0A4S3K644_9GAMM|nr:dihydrodipicolinate synthase family protein [Panacagrimonas perspica]TDU26841.1 4-hydroxy-tetrahydrodipicolinate synthase [Panacagrimonas perspica]THD03615.1 hypothetical protein B1810_08685 [Panacagrimonas perspica]